MTAIKLFSLGDFGFLQFILRKISQVIMANTGFMMVSPSTRFDGPWFVVPNLPKEWEVHRQIFGNGRLLKQFQGMSLGSWLLGVYCLGFPWILWFFFKQGKEMTASSNPWEPKILKPQHLWKFCWENIRRFVRFFVTVEIAWYFFHHGSCKKWCLIAPSRWQPTKVNPAVATPPPPWLEGPEGLDSPQSPKIKMPLGLGICMRRLKTGDEVKTLLLHSKMTTDTQEKSCLIRWGF